MLVQLLHAEYESLQFRLECIRAEIEVQEAKIFARSCEYCAARVADLMKEKDRLLQELDA